MDAPQAQAPGGQPDLAGYLDREVANTLELARMAHDAGLKSSFQNLIGMAQRQRKDAQKAHDAQKLKMVLSALAQQEGPAIGGAIGQARQAMQPPMPMGSAMPMGPMAMGPAGALPQYALGGTHPGGPAIVGEDGPEVVDMPPGSTVTPNPMTILELLQMLAQGGIPAYAFGTSMNRNNAPAAPVGAGQQIAGTSWNERPDYAPGTVGLQSIGQGNSAYGAGFLKSQLGAGTYAGAFDPLGSQAAANLSRDAILGGMGARQDAGAKIADLYGGGDPSFRAYQRAKAQADTQSEAARAYEQARAGGANSGIDYIRQLMMGYSGALTRKDPKEPNPAAAIGGQLLGAGLGAIIPSPQPAAVPQ